MVNKLSLDEFAQAAKNFTQAVANEALEPIQIALENLFARAKGNCSYVEIQAEIGSIIETIKEMRGQK